MSGMHRVHFYPANLSEHTNLGCQKIWDHSVCWQFYKGSGGPYLNDSYLMCSGQHGRLGHN